MAEQHEIVELGSTNRDGNDDVSLAESSSVVRHHRLDASEEAMFGSSEKGAVLAPESSAASSSSVYYSARIESMLRSRTEFVTAVDWEIEASKDHWSELQSPRREESSSDSEDERVHLTEAEIVESLQRQYPQLGNFFRDGAGYVEVGEKIAEGGQADIFTARRIGPGYGYELAGEYVLKVFKKEVSVRDLQKQWPLGMIHWLPERNMASRAIFRSPIWEGMVVMNGRFAFLMNRFWGDLRKLIDKRMECNRNRCPPFIDAELIHRMGHIATGMKGLHEDNIIHRDLKASNVLVRMSPTREKEGWYTLAIADYECSGGIVGTGFWRAPEILQGLKDHMKTRMPIAPELFTKKSDVFSFAMTCYEMITGKTPFEGVMLNNYDVVLQGERPILPEGTKPWIKELLSRCWHHDPSERPDFASIAQHIGDHSRDDI